MKSMNKLKKILYNLIGLSIIAILVFNKDKIFDLSHKPSSLISGINFDDSLNQRLQIEVLNGCGVKGVADLYTNFLRENGYDVINYQNAQHFDYKNTTILVHKNNLNDNKLNDLIKVDPLNVKNLFDEKIFFDLTLIIGKDYKNLESYNKVSMYYEPYQ
tara:strand:+ start:165 stop:641 length:477 start_codon:yes stop_codon:yes gene_type:complete